MAWLRVTLAIVAGVGPVCAATSCAEVLGFERAVRLEEASATDGGRSDAAADAALEDPALACADDIPSTVDPARSVLVRHHLLDLETNESVVDVRIRTCTRGDLECVNPKDGADGGFPPTDGGFLERRVDYAFNGYFEFVGPRYLTTLLFLNAVEKDRPDGQQVQLLTPALFKQLAFAATGQSDSIDPTLGHALVFAEDCLGVPRRGVRIEPVNVVAGKTRPFYIYDLLPDPNGKETDASGNSGIINLPPGLVTVNGFSSDGKKFGTVTFGVRAGKISYASLPPKL